MLRTLAAWWLRHLVLAAVAGVVAGLMLAWLFGLADGSAINVWGVTW